MSCCCSVFKDLIEKAHNNINDYVDCKTDQKYVHEIVSRVKSKMDLS